MGEGQSVEQLERLSVQRGLPDMPDGFVRMDPTSPEAQQRIAEALGSGKPKEFPMIEDPTGDTVMLAGGIVHDDEPFRRAEVRELNGSDEEYIVRAVTGGGTARLMQAILERGVVKIGPVPATSALLEDLLVGDQEALVMGVRVATYGETMTMTVVCSGCQVESKIKVDLTEDVKSKVLEWDFREPHRTVELRKGRSAVIRLAKGSDQIALSEMNNKTRSELNSEMLARCIVSLDGNEIIAPRKLAVVKELGAADRDTLIDFIIDKQPGPLYGDVKYECTVCRTETPLGLDAGVLFPWLA